MEIKRIGPDDWQLFRDVRLASLDESPESFCSTHDEWADASEERWRQRLTDVGLTLVAADGDAILGVISGQPDGPDWIELSTMWVTPAARGTGVASALIDGVVGWADERGRGTYLLVLNGNERARHAYERKGFVDVGSPVGWSATGSTASRMERQSQAEATQVDPNRA